MNKKKLRNFGFESDNDTFVIAEIGINHGGSLEVAKRLIDSAADIHYREESASGPPIHI